MNISTSDLEALKQKTKDYFDFIKPFENAIHRDQLGGYTLPFEDFVRDVVRVHDGLDMELKARATPSLIAGDQALE